MLPRSLPAPFCLRTHSPFGNGNSLPSSAIYLLLETSPIFDLAKAVLFLLQGYDEATAINVGTGVDIEISELASLISEVTNFKGSINWDTSKPDGTPRKLLDVSRINQLGWNSEILLTDGIKSTYEWFVQNHP